MVTVDKTLVQLVNDLTLGVMIPLDQWYAGLDETRAAQFEQLHSQAYECLLRSREALNQLLGEKLVVDIQEDFDKNVNFTKNQ